MSRSDKHAAQDHHDRGDDRDDAVVVHLPEDPPALTPAAGRPLLRLLRNAWRRDDDGGNSSIDEWKEAA